MVGTGAAGVKDSLFKSGNSRLFRRRGELERPEGDAGFDSEGDRLFELREGMGRRRFGCLEDEADAG